LTEQPDLLKQQVAIVTGAARGIGKAICQDFVACGAKVVATDVLAQELSDTATELGDQVVAKTHDVSSQADWQRVVEETLAEFGRIDILVNNAGILLMSTIEETPLELFQKMFDINVTGVFLGMQHVTPIMKKAGYGAIVNFSSTAAILPNNATGVYAATKYALRGLTRSGALELGPHGIRVNSIHPGGVNTPMTNPDNLPSDEVNQRYQFVPQQRGCEPSEIAASVRFLASAQGSYCNGAELVVDGGMTAGLYFPNLPGHPDSE